MEVKVYASKSTLGIIVLVLTIFVIVFAYWGIGKRYEDIEKHQVVLCQDLVQIKMRSSAC